MQKGKEMVELARLSLSLSLSVLVGLMSSVGPTHVMLCQGSYDSWAPTISLYVRKWVHPLVASIRNLAS